MKCMLDITVEEVFYAVKEKLSGEERYNGDTS
jgi:hypothetical protein